MIMRKLVFIYSSIFLVLAVSFFSCVSTNETPVPCKVVTLVEGYPKRGVSLYKLHASPRRGYFCDAYVFVPAQSALVNYQKNYLLVSPNNSGKSSETISFQEQYVLQAVDPSHMSWEARTAFELQIPMLMPVFPRTRDVVLSGSIHRGDASRWKRKKG